jgi:endonuclease/exonuclease/phosphatase family metal-dependent hydrolase
MWLAIVQLLALPVFLLGFELPTQVVETDHDISIVTYNIHGGESPFQPIIGILSAIDADIVCLQETGGAWDETRIERLASELGLNGVVQSGDIAILSRHPIVRSEVVYLEGNPRTRDIVEAVIDINGAEVTVVSLHLIPMLLDYAWRAGFPGAIDVMRNTSQVGIAQAEFIAGRYGRGHRPIVIAGDFNFTPGGVRYRAMDKAFGDSFARVGTGFGYTIKSNWPTMRVDYVWTRNLYPTSCEVYPSSASDHRPLVTRFRLSES